MQIGHLKTENIGRLHVYRALLCRHVQDQHTICECDSTSSNDFYCTVQLSDCNLRYVTADFQLQSFPNEGAKKISSRSVGNVGPYMCT